MSDTESMDISADDVATIRRVLEEHPSEQLRRALGLRTHQDALDLHTDLVTSGMRHTPGTTHYRLGPPGSNDDDYDPDVHMTTQTEHFALVRDGRVVNVAAVNKDTPHGRAWLDAVTPDHDAVIEVTDHEMRPGPGWHHDGTRFHQPPMLGATYDAETDTYKALYRDATPDAPAEIIFIVDGQPVGPVPLVDGEARVPVTPTAAHPIEVVAGDLSVMVWAAPREEPT